MTQKTVATHALRIEKLARGLGVTLETEVSMMQGGRGRLTVVYFKEQEPTVILITSDERKADAFGDALEMVATSFPSTVIAQPTIMPPWLEEEFDSAEKTVQSWNPGKRAAAGLKDFQQALLPIQPLESPIPANMYQPDPQGLENWSDGKFENHPYKRGGFFHYTVHAHTNEAGHLEFNSYDLPEGFHLDRKTGGVIFEEQ